MSLKQTMVRHYNQLHFWNGGTKFVHMIASHLVKQYRFVIVANTTEEAVVKRFTNIGVEVVVYYRWPKTTKTRQKVVL